eukprot:751178-Hanusia_phi.AAC.1
MAWHVQGKFGKKAGDSATADSNIMPHTGRFCKAFEAAKRRRRRILNLKIRGFGNSRPAYPGAAPSGRARGAGNGAPVNFEVFQSSFFGCKKRVARGSLLAAAS